MRYFSWKPERRADLSGLFGTWSIDNLVLNDHKVAEDLKRVIERELQDEVDARPDGQSNVSRQAFMLCNHCSWCNKNKPTLVNHGVCVADA